MYGGRYDGVPQPLSFTVRSAYMSISYSGFSHTPQITADHNEINLKFSKCLCLWPQVIVSGTAAQLRSQK